MLDIDMSAGKARRFDIDPPPGARWSCAPIASGRKWLRQGSKQADVETTAGPAGWSIEPRTSQRRGQNHARTAGHCALWCSCAGAGAFLRCLYPPNWLEGRDTAPVQQPPPGKAAGPEWRKIAWLPPGRKVAAEVRLQAVSSWSSRRHIWTRHQGTRSGCKAALLQSRRAAAQPCSARFEYDRAALQASYSELQAIGQQLFFTSARKRVASGVATICGDGLSFDQCAPRFIECRAEIHSAFARLSKSISESL